MIRRLLPDDRARATRLLGNDPGVLDSPNHRIQIDAAGEGAAVWAAPAKNEDAEATLGAVTTRRNNRRLFYQLIAACAEDALREGFTRAHFTIHDPRLLLRIKRDFVVTVQEAGWEPNTHKAVEWQISVDLRDALTQLAKVLG